MTRGHAQNSVQMRPLNTDADGSTAGAGTSMAYRLRDHRRL